MTILSGASAVGDWRGLGFHLDKGTKRPRDEAVRLDRVPGTLRNDVVRFVKRGLAARGIVAAMAELAAGAVMTRTSKTLYHVHVNPRFQNEIARSLWWRLFEREFSLERAKFCGSVHSEGQRGDHEHRVYCITDAVGKSIRLSHDFTRREKVSVLVCHQLGLPVPPIAHPRAVAAALRKEGRDDVADWLMAAPRSQQPRPIALTPAQRQQAERTKVDPGEVGRLTLAAWQRARDGPDFLQALIRTGLIPAHGYKKIVVIDRGGGSHPVDRTLKKAAKSTGFALDVKSLSRALADWTLLPTASEVQRDRIAQQPPPEIPMPLDVPSHDGHRGPDAAPSGDRTDCARDPQPPVTAGGGPGSRDGLGRRDARDGDDDPGQQRFRGSLGGDRGAPDVGPRGGPRALSQRVAARTRAVLLMARRKAASPEVDDGAKIAAEAARLAMEETARQKAADAERLLKARADALLLVLREEADRDNEYSTIRINEITMALDTPRRPPRKPDRLLALESALFHRQVEAEPTHKALSSAHGVRNKLYLLPWIMTTPWLRYIPGRKHLPWKWFRAKRIAEADATLTRARAAHEPFRRKINTAQTRCSDAQLRWEVACKRGQEAWRADLISERKALRDRVRLLTARPEYVRKTSAEIAEAIRQGLADPEDGGGGGGGSAPPAVPPPPTRSDKP